MSSSRTEMGAGAATLVDVTMPQMGVSVAEGTVVAWRVEVGDRIAADADDLRDLDRQDRHRGPGPGNRHRGRDPGGGRHDRVGGNAAGADRGGRRRGCGWGAGRGWGAGLGAWRLAARTAVRRPRRPRALPTCLTPTARAATAPPTARRYSPVVQRIAAEHDIDLAQVEGTGRDGRVRKQDVLAFIELGA